MPASVEELRLEEVRIPFKIAFKHAAAERGETSSVWVEARSGRTIGFGESCPRPYVTGETLNTARAFFQRYESSIRSRVTNLDTLHQWMGEHRDALNENPAAWCAMELALLDLIAQTGGTTIEGLLSLPELEGLFQYTAVLGDAPTDAFKAVAEEYRRLGFTDYKVKLSGNAASDRERVDVLRGWPAASRRFRADANNLWSTADEAIAGIARLDFPFFAVEEPIRRRHHAELSRIARALECQIILDESCVRLDDLAPLAREPQQWIVNVRVSKMGGLVRSLDLVRAARAIGVQLIVGAQVGETTLLTRAALPVAKAAGADLVAQEGAFGTWLLAHDVCEEPLMFGARGVLDVASYRWLQRPGWGISKSDRFTSLPGRSPQ